jgi:hypothetical protein
MSVHDILFSLVKADLIAKKTSINFRSAEQCSIAHNFEKDKTICLCGKFFDHQNTFLHGWVLVNND